MKKLFFFSIFISLFLITFWIVNKNDPRSNYENYILSVYQNAPDKQIHQSDETIKAADQPDMAALQEFITTVDPKLKYVPAKRLVKAYNYTRSLELSRDYEPPVSWDQTGANMGGRTRALMFDPNDPDHKAIWAGSVTGGLWHNDDITNYYEEWEPVDDFWADLSISCITYDPNNPQVFYVGTGEAQTARIIYRASSGVGNGIYKTTDGGVTWNTLVSTEGFDYITDIVVKDENGQSVVYAAVASGTYMGEDHVSEPSDGLFRSTDGGESWEQVLPDIPGESVPYAPADIELSSTGRLFVGTMENLDLKGGATILYSDNGLPGSWTVYNHYNTVINNESYYNIPARTLVATTPADTNRVYAQFVAGYVSGFTYYRGRYMAKSTDGGVTWSSLNIPDSDWSTLGWHAFVLKVSPTDADRVFSGGLDLWGSTNGGSSWRHISDWSLMYWGGGDMYVHADQHKIQFQEGNANRAVFVSDGGVFSTAEADQSYPDFVERNHGYNTLQFYSCCINPTAGEDKYIGGLQDNGTLLYNGEPLDINDMIDGGDGAFCFWDQNDPSVYITSSYYNNYSFWKNNAEVGSSNPGTGTFISPADYDYKENILYSNAVSFFGAHPNKLFRVKGVPNPYSEQEIFIGTSSDVPFSHVKYSPLSPAGTTTLFLGTQSGKLYKITNAESSPHATNLTGTDFPEASISCVAIGSTEDILLVTFSNYGVSSVWLTLDGGQTWEEKETNLPDMPIRWAIFHPQNDDQTLLATETGIWATNNLRFDDTEWAPAVDGMANVRVDMLKLRTADNLVLAATHGRGLLTTTYEMDIYDGVKNNTTEDIELKVYPNPASHWLNIKAEIGESTEIIVTISDLSGRIIHTEKLKTGGQFQHQLDVSNLSKGVYLVGLRSENQQWQKKVVVE